MSPDPTPALTEGTRLGPYEVLGVIGAGGMGEVYRARDTRLDRVVAVKVLAARMAADPDLRERFEREARAISSLNHPNICVLHDVGREKPQPATEKTLAVDFLSDGAPRRRDPRRAHRPRPVPTDSRQPAHRA